VLLVNVNTTHAHIDVADRLPLFLRLIHDIAMIPGVSAVGASTLTPVGGVAVVSFVNAAGFPVTSDSERAAATNVITAGWLAANGLYLRVGRDFDALDTINRPPVPEGSSASCRTPSTTRCVSRCRRKSSCH
jgi:hypothetical protein